MLETEMAGVMNLGLYNLYFPNSVIGYVSKKTGKLTGQCLVPYWPMTAEQEKSRNECGRFQGSRISTEIRNEHTNTKVSSDKC